LVTEFLIKLKLTTSSIVKQKQSSKISYILKNHLSWNKNNHLKHHPYWNGENIICQAYRVILKNVQHYRYDPSRSASIRMSHLDPPPDVTYFVSLWFLWSVCHSHPSTPASACDLFCIIMIFVCHCMFRQCIFLLEPS